MHRFAKVIVLAAAVALPSLAATAPASAYTERVAYSFCRKVSDGVCTDGRNPQATLIVDASGTIFGTTQQGGKAKFGGFGTIFELVPNAKKTKWTHHVLYDFCRKSGCPDGAEPTGLIEDVSGNLYGTTTGGGKHGRGVIFELQAPPPGGAWTLNVLHSFCAKPGCADGDNTSSGTEASNTMLTYAGATSGAPYDGTSPLFGVAGAGGNGGGNAGSGGGVAFRLARDGAAWKYTVIHAFCQMTGGGTCPADGANPTGGLVMDAAGNLYGATGNGGNGGELHEGVGTVFEISPVGRKWGENVLYDFCPVLVERDCPDGATPLSALTIDAAGNLYGTTSAGGAGPGDPNNSPGCDPRFGCGAVFKLTKNGAIWSQSVLYSFCEVSGCADGVTPVDGLVMDASGDLFGTTPAGGPAEGGGVAYEIQAGGGERTIYAFCSQTNCTDGSEASSALAFDGAGDLFGTTRQGGTKEPNSGTVFELQP